MKKRYLAFSLALTLVFQTLTINAETVSENTVVETVEADTDSIK